MRGMGFTIISFSRFTFQHFLFSRERQGIRVNDRVLQEYREIRTILRRRYSRTNKQNRDNQNYFH